MIRGAQRASAGRRPRRVTMSSMLRVLLRRARLRSCGVSPWPNSRWNSLRGLCFHRQRRRRRAERDRAGVAAAVVAVARRRRRRCLRSPTSSDGSGVSWPMCCAAIWSTVMPPCGSWLLRGCTHDSQVPGTSACTGAALAGLVVEAADDGQLLLERLERLEDRRQLEVRALGRRRPLLHDRAVREVDEAHARLRRRGGLRQRGARRNHRVQQRQADRDARAAQNVRRDRCFLVMNIVVLLVSRSARASARSRRRRSAPAAPAASGTARSSRCPCTIDENR